MALKISQASTLPPAQPVYVLRGHSAQVHSTHFFRENLRLLSGDSEGWVVLWSLPIKRAAAVWRAHEGTVVGLGSWDDDKIISYELMAPMKIIPNIVRRHGRDNKICVWQLREEDEENFSTTLPINDSAVERKKPWLMHSLPVNALNFCSFAMCQDLQSSQSQPKSDILVAVPGIQDGQVNIISLPSESRFATLPTPKDIKTGMVMAICLHYFQTQLSVLVGYESGHVCIWKQDASTMVWRIRYSHKAHSQPILSLDIAPRLGHFYTSSADAIIARHPLFDENGEAKSVQTKHAGQQSLTVRSDDKIFATAGWDGRVRVYSAKTMKELAVLKWHKDGCYAIAFASVMEEASKSNSNSTGDVNQESISLRDLTVSEQRTAKAKAIHWLAAGSKDGKVSLWDIY